MAAGSRRSLGEIVNNEVRVRIRRWTSLLTWDAHMKERMPSPKLGKLDVRKKGVGLEKLRLQYRFALGRRTREREVGF